MPLDDFRRQIDPTATVDLDVTSHCAQRYGVSLIATILRWLAYTVRRAVLVVAREDFILWSRASDTALKTGAFFRTSGVPIEIPSPLSQLPEISSPRVAAAFYMDPVCGSTKKCGN
jgi:hypothetical protein